MEDKRYNGWVNYETWLVNLWIDNDQGEHEYWQEQTEAEIKDSYNRGCDRDTATLRSGLVRDRRAHGCRLRLATGTRRGIRPRRRYPLTECRP